MMDLLPARFRGLDDPDSRAVVAALEAVGAGRTAVPVPVVDPGFRAELRAQLVAVAPRLVAEGVLEPVPARPAGPRHQAPRSARVAEPLPAVPSRRPGRSITVLLGGAAVVALTLGGASVLSHDALPGDPLYGLKRSAENLSLSLAGNDVDRGRSLLENAQTRVDEASSLLTRPQSMALSPGHDAAGPVSDRVQTLIAQTLASADSETRQGVSTITDNALATGSTDGLAVVTAWTPGQQQRIAALLARLPAGPAADGAKASATEITQAQARAGALLAELQAGVTCPDRSRDGFGPMPCPAGSAVTVPRSSTPRNAPAPGATAPALPLPGTTAAAPIPGTRNPTPPVAVPTPSSPGAGGLPTPSGGVGVGVSGVGSATLGTCGVQVSLPLLGGLSVGPCPS